LFAAFVGCAALLLSQDGVVATNDVVRGVNGQSVRRRCHDQAGKESEGCKGEEGDELVRGHEREIWLVVVALKERG
jgi:hypothetical protein